MQILSEITKRTKKVLVAKVLAVALIVTPPFAGFGVILAPQLQKSQEVYSLEAKYVVIKEDEIQLAVPYVHQYNDLPENRKSQIVWSACGPTSLTMAFLDQNVDTDLITVIDKLPSSVFVKGKMSYNIKAGAEVYGYKASSVDPNAKGIYEALRGGHPVVLNIQNFNGWVGHYMVVTGIRGYHDGKAHSLIVHDPFFAQNREYVFKSERTLLQPEGYVNYIGNTNPFFLEKI